MGDNGLSPVDKSEMVFPGVFHLLFVGADNILEVTLVSAVRDTHGNYQMVHTDDGYNINYTNVVMWKRIGDPEDKPTEQTWEEFNDAPAG